MSILGWLRGVAVNLYFGGTATLTSSLIALALPWALLPASVQRALSVRQRHAGHDGADRVSTVTLFQWWADWVCSLYFWSAAGGLEKLMRARLVFTAADAADAARLRDGPQERALVMCSHRTTWDWLFSWMWMVRLPGRASSEKIAVKRALTLVPGFHGMQMLGFFDLARKWAGDRAHMTELMRHYRDANFPLRLLLFPEGTDFRSSLAASRRFAEREGLQQYDYVLHPRTTGMAHLAEQGADGFWDAVYDVTVGYPDRCPETEIAMLKGVFPREVHFHVTRYEASSLPLGDVEAMAEWTRARWAEKEARLKQFYAAPEGERSFGGTPVFTRASDAARGVGPRLWCAALGFATGIVALVLALWQWPLFRWAFLGYFVCSYLVVRITGNVYPKVPRSAASHRD